MPRSDALAPLPPPNRLLAALPATEYVRLQPHLHLVPLAPKAVLHHPNQAIRYVYFPTSGVISLVTVLGEGGGIEVGLVGREGMAGLPVFLGVEVTPARCLVQVPGEALRMRAEDFRAQVAPDSRLHQLLLRYTHTLLAQVSQSVACNALHPVGKRLCRWLLLVHTRVEGDRFPLTHQLLATMLGVRRASVTEAAQGLQEGGLIRYGRGQVTVLDRAGLEAAACECFRVSQAELDRLPG